MNFFACCICCCCTLALVLPGAAQNDTTLLTKNFKFTDGIYLTFAAFQRNQPDLQWKEVRAQVFSNPQTFLTQIEDLQLKDTTQHQIKLTDVWGISLDGIPYLQLPADAVDGELATFAGLKVRGKLCYFEYERTEETDVKIQAYNPLNGRPFRTGFVKRTLPVLYPRILNFNTGEITPFDKENLLEQIEEDQQLIRTIEQLSPREVADKLFKCLLIYDDRNPAFIKTTTIN